MSDPVSPPGATVRDRLAQEENVWLCTVRPEGSPHVTPVWFVFLRDRWWIGVDGASVKVRNVERSSRGWLALEDGLSPVVAEGEAVLCRGLFPEEVMDAFAATYGWDVSAPRTPDGERVLIEFPVRPRLLAGAAQ